MPVYQYHCRDCDRSFERVERMEDHGTQSPSCPFCGGKAVEPQLSEFFAKTARKS